MVSVGSIKELREKTGAGMMDCKVALVETQGSLDQAVEYLRKKGLAKASKKADRETSEGLIGSYVHFGGKIGVLVEVNCETDFVARTTEFHELVKDLSMQIAGANPAPRYVQRQEVGADVIENERAIYMSQARELKKPEEVIALIVEGKIDKFLQDICLLEQPYIKDPTVKIKDLVAEKISKLGENIRVVRFVKYQLGR